ncbi:MAG: hypothetical protein VB013_03950 [Anaerolineaceae bacterium]|nr:hypothetical protein [Anaerolineaceae bacterium]
MIRKPRSFFPSSRAAVLHPTKALTNQDAKVHLKRFESLILFLLSLLINLVVAYFLNYVLHIGNGDALSRTANAYYVLYSREPHLAAVGFVWPPLPSILQIPLLPLTRALGSVFFAGNILSSLFGAGVIVLTNRLLAHFKFPPAVRWILVVLLQFHPNTLYLFASGMAEPVFLFCVLVVFLGLYQMPESMRSWVLVGMSLAVAFLVRYETLPILAGVALAIIVHMWGSDDWRPRTEGWLLAVLTPPVYAIVMWIFFNWTLLGDPLYFYRSFYSLGNASDIARSIGLGHPLYLAWGNIIESIRVGLTRSFEQNPAYPVMGLLALISIFWHKDRKGFGLFIVMLSVTAFSILQVYLGTLANWMRYWFYAAPFALVMAGIVYSHLKPKWHLVFYVALIGLFLAGTPLSLQAMRAKTVGADEQRLAALVYDPISEPALRAKDWYWVNLTDAPVVAKEVDKLSENGLVLVDSSTSFSVIMAAQYPRRLYITNDDGFFKVLANPIGTVKYMLVLDPEQQLSIFNVTYPTLFEHGADWATLVWDSGTETGAHWRIYEIHPIE